MEEAALARRVVALAAGRIALEGPPAEVFGRADVLEAMGLTLPVVPALARALRGDGAPLEEGILSSTDLVEALARLSAAGARGGER
jgi:hypothetical protein